MDHFNPRCLYITFQCSVESIHSIAIVQSWYNVTGSCICLNNHADVQHFLHMYNLRTRKRNRSVQWEKLDSYYISKRNYRLIKNCSHIVLFVNHYHLLGYLSIRKEFLVRTIKHLYTVFYLDLKSMLYLVETDLILWLKIFLLKLNA